MLSVASRPYISASIPVLREYGLAITLRFYRDMFTAQPELMQLFNMGNQANGSQQHALASALFAYAANIDNKDVLAPVIRRIANKHASLGLTPSHYPIVGRYLLGAIRAVLGEAATPELLAAWDEAYWLLADELITTEAHLYQNKGVPLSMPFSRVRVARREVQSDNAVALTLAAVDGKPLRDFQPGQYISVEVPLDHHCRQLRQYSLSAERGLATWRITIKREEGSLQVPAGAVSNWLHANACEGTELAVSAPFGDFTPELQSRHPLVLLSAGIGITPMLSILRTLAIEHSTRPVLFAYATRSGRHHVHRTDVQWASARMPQLHTHISYALPEPVDHVGRDYDHAGTMPIAALLNKQSTQHFKDGAFYLCGPIGFMQAQRHALISAGVGVERIHREVFGPDLLDNLL